MFLLLVLSCVFVFFCLHYLFSLSSVSSFHQLLLSITRSKDFSWTCENSQGLKRLCFTGWEGRLNRHFSIHPSIHLCSFCPSLHPSLHPSVPPSLRPSVPRWPQSCCVLNVSRQIWQINTDSTCRHRPVGLQVRVYSFTLSHTCCSVPPLSRPSASLIRVYLGGGGGLRSTWSPRHGPGVLAAALRLQWKRSLWPTRHLCRSPEGAVKLGSRISVKVHICAELSFRALHAWGSARR